jgi:sialidase-1
MAEHGYDGPKNTKTFIIHSDDDGETWSKPKDITRQARRENRISVGSPGRGIQITRGEYKGRIIIPFYEVRRLSDTKRDWNNSCMYSDDNGESWILSQAIPHPSTLKGFGNEAQLVELKDGSLLFNARNQGGKYRKISQSKDGGKSWTEMKVDEGLPGIHCMGSILRYSWPDSGQSIIVYSGPASKKGRTNGTLRISYDEGLTWKDSLEMASPYYGYSCLTKTVDGRIGVLYETDGCRKIKFSLLTIDEIKAGNK